MQPSKYLWFLQFYSDDDVDNEIALETNDVEHAAQEPPKGNLK